MIRAVSTMDDCAWGGSPDRHSYRKAPSSLDWDGGETRDDEASVALEGKQTPP